jgi:hypothetical protein
MAFSGSIFWMNGFRNVLMQTDSDEWFHMSQIKSNNDLPVWIMI